MYLCIDLKSFYASVECVERNLDPFQVNLVVADPTRGSGAITLAATPHIKNQGVKSRGRIYEIPEDIEYVIAPPRMHLYMEYSARVYEVLLKYIAPADIHVYSIDEAFLYIRPYLKLYQMNARKLAQKIMEDIYQSVKITATAGVGTNLFLAKVALDIMAKHVPDNIGYLNESMFRQKLWRHQPITDFWMIGKGIEKRLKKYGIQDLYAIAMCPPSLLYQEFGVNAEILIDHAWGKEPVRIQDIKAYRPKGNSISNSQILFEDYTYKDAFLILKEMVDLNVLTLTEKHLVTNHISLYIGYSKEVRKPSRGSCTITNRTNSFKILMEEFGLLYKRIADVHYPIRQIGISFGQIKPECYEEYDLFTDFKEVKKERDLQRTLVQIRRKYGKNAVLKGMNFLEKSTARYRNETIGGHKA